MNDDIQTPISWGADDVFFHGARSTFYVNAGTYYRTISKRGTVITGIVRRYEQQGIAPKEARMMAKDEIDQRELDGHVEWVGELAGHRKGLFRSYDGKPLLVTSSPNIPTPAAGAMPTISKILRQAFPDHHQMSIFCGWLKGGFLAVRDGLHQPAPLMAIAGTPNAGKSLLSYLVKLTLGGRSANPLTAWSKTLPWNDDLCSAELLLLDDCQGSLDHRTRMEFGANFKSSIYSDSVSMNKRNCSSVSVRPVWRVMVCMNDNPENLLVLPPVASDTRDKITLLKISKIELDRDTSTPEGRRALQDDIKGELGAFAAFLKGYVIPDHLRDSRSGTMAWQHPELLAKIDQTRPETKLLELLATSINSRSDLWHDLPCDLSATEIESRLSAFGSATADQARKLFTWQAACGAYLAKLADSECEQVTRGEVDRHSKTKKYHIRRS